jgi:RNA polymerase sigma-70 factor (ECF subfamily)
MTIKETITAPAASATEPPALFEPASAPDLQTDSAIVRRIGERDQQALALLYDRYAALIYTLALRITGRSELAEEVVQAVFAACWKSSAPALEGDLAAGLVALTRQCARQIGGRAGPSAAQRRADAGEQPGLKLRAAIAALPPDQREAIELSYYEGLRVSAIAARLGLSSPEVLRALRLGMDTLSASAGDRSARI